METIKIAAVFPKSEPSESKEIKIDIEKTTSDLKQLAESFESAHPKEIEKHLNVIKKNLGAFITQILENQIQIYDYDAAMDICSFSQNS